MAAGGLSRTRAKLLLGLAALVFGVATAGMLAGREPFATWYYQLAWYPLLVGGDAFLRLRTGRFFLLDRPARAAALFAWSVPFWLFFELLNFRMANWYYVFVPADPLARWAGIMIAFATVLPAIFLAERVLAALSLIGIRSRRVALGRRSSFALQLVGAAMAVLALTWPRVFFPFIWGAVTLLLDPWVYRRDPARSLLGALKSGRPALIVRLLLGGLGIGLIWEAFNAEARGKWIYTVPGLEELKLFEMPVAGFLGFPVLALDGWAVWQTLVLLRLAPGGFGGDAPPPIRSRSRPTRWIPRAAVAIAAIAFSAAVLRGMERFTISSYSPRTADLPGVAAPPLERAGYDIFDLAGADASEVAQRTGLDAAAAARAVERARLATLRGIGTDNAGALVEAGIGSVEELAELPSEVVTDRLRRAGVRAPPARVRVWVHAARRAVGDAGRL